MFTEKSITSVRENLKKILVPGTRLYQGRLKLLILLMIGMLGLMKRKMSVMKDMR